MFRSLIAGTLVLALAVVSLSGCGARAEVAKDKILAKIDSVLGELDVKRKKIELKQKELRTQIDDLQYKRAQAEARLNLMNEKKNESESKLNNLKGKLEQVQGLIAKAKDSEDGTVTSPTGKTYTVADFNDDAKQLISQYKNGQTRLEGMVAGISAMSDSVAFLETQESTAKELMKKMETRIEAIDAKKFAVDAVKQATSITGDSTSINDDLAALEKEIDELSVDVDATLKVEQSKLDELTSSSSRIDEMLKESPNLDSLNNEIDALLGNSNDK